MVLVPDMAACFEWLIKWDALSRPVRHVVSSKEASRKAKRTGRRPRAEQEDPLVAQHPIREWARPEGAPAPAPAPPQDPTRCPKCGRPLKRRHGRAEIHDPARCAAWTVESIHDS